MDHSPARIGNGLATVVVNADGSITLAPVGLATLGKIYYAAQNGLAAALAAAGSNGHVIVADAQAVTTALTAPAGATLEVKRGGLLTFSGPGSLTVNGVLMAGPYQIFAGGGAVTLGPGACQQMYLEWWGGPLAFATPTACPDASAALTAALAAVPANKTATIRLLPGYYAMNGLLNQSFARIVGAGRALNSGANNAPSAIVPFVHTSPALQVANGSQQIVDVELSGVSFLATAADGGTGTTGLLVGGGCKHGRFDVASYGFTADCILVTGDPTYGTYENHLYRPTVQPGAGGNGVRAVWGGVAGCTDTNLVTPILQGASSGAGFPLVVDGCTVKVMGGYLQSNLTGGAGVKFLKTATTGAQFPFLLNFGMDIDSNASTDVLVTLDATTPATWFDVSLPMPGLYNVDGVMLLGDGVTTTAHIGQIAAAPNAQLVNPRLIGTLSLENPTTGTQYADTNISTDSAGSLNLAAHGSISLSPLSDIVNFKAQAGNNTIEADFVSNGTTNKVKASSGVLSLLPGTALALGNPSPATTATTGDAYIPVCAGAPTGVPATVTGYVAMRYDSTTHKFWIYDGGWKGVVVA